MLIRGQTALDSKEYGIAEKRVFSALSLDAMSGKSACGFARASLALGKPNAAENALDPIAAGIIASSTSAEFKALYGLTLYNLNNVLDAETWLASALNDDPGRTEVLVPLAQAAIQRRDYSAAPATSRVQQKPSPRIGPGSCLKANTHSRIPARAMLNALPVQLCDIFPKIRLRVAAHPGARKSTDEARHAEAADLAKAVLDLAMNEDTAWFHLKRREELRPRIRLCNFL